jgi:hypothetical protein
MFRNLSLRSLYEEQDELTLWQRIALSVVWNVCPVIVFMGAFWAFRTWVWTEPPMIVNWK